MYELFWVMDDDWSGWVAGVEGGVCFMFLSIALITGEDLGQISFPVHPCEDASCVC